MELLIGVFLGTVGTSLYMYWDRRRITPYMHSCVHCSNGGKQFIISSSDKKYIRYAMNRHKQSAHPYAV